MRGLDASRLPARASRLPLSPLPQEPAAGPPATSRPAAFNAPPLTLRRVALPGLLGLLSLLALVLLADDHGSFDLQVYSGAVRSWVEADPLYDYLKPGTRYGFTYPPFAALLMLPVAVLPLWLCLAVNVAVDALVITATTWWLAARYAPRHGWSVWYVVAVAVPLVSLLEPVRDTVGFGQVNLALVALVVVDVELLRRGSRWAGVGTGLAAAIKLTPALFVVMLLAARPRAALNAVVVAALATVSTFVIAPGTSRQFWTEALRDTSRVGDTHSHSNQAISGLLARLADTADAPGGRWLLAVLVIGAVGLTRAVQAVRCGDDVAGLALTGLTAGLISPLTWVHHLWWVVPAIAVLVDTGMTRGTRRHLVAAAGALALFSSSLPDHARQKVGQHLDGNVLQILGENSYVIVLLLLVLLLPIRASTRLPRGVQAREVVRV